MRTRGEAPIALVGIMGAGKSAVAGILARRLGLRAVDLDREVENAAGTSVAAVFEERGEEAFRDLEEAVLRSVAAAGACVIACGGGVVTRAASRALLRDGCRTVWLEADPRVAASRVAGDGGARPLLAGHRPEERLASLLAERGPLYAESCLARVGTDGRTPEEVATAVLAALAAVAAGGPGMASR